MMPFVLAIIIGILVWFALRFFWPGNALQMRIRARLKGWRTMIVNAALSVLPVLQLTEVAQVMPDDWLGWYALIMALINMYMRKITTTPMGKSK